MEFIAPASLEEVQGFIILFRNVFVAEKPLGAFLRCPRHFLEDVAARRCSSYELDAGIKWSQRQL